MAIVTKKTIHGTEVTFEVDSNGGFYTTIEDVGTYTGKVLTELEEQVTKALKRATTKKSIDVTVLNVRPRQKGDFSYGSALVSGEGAIDVTLRGWSDRTSDLLITIDGKKDKIDASNAKAIVKKLTPAEHREHAQLVANLESARRALEAFAAPRIFDWREYFEVGR